MRDRGRRLFGRLPGRPWSASQEAPQRPPGGPPQESEASQGAAPFPPPGHRLEAYGASRSPDAGQATSRTGGTTRFLSRWITTRFSVMGVTDVGGRVKPKFLPVALPPAYRRSAFVAERPSPQCSRPDTSIR